jgi:pyruvate,water dikinase
MMTDAMKPLGLSFFLLGTSASMHAAGGRLFVDVTANLASPSGRNMLINGLGHFDPLTKDALTTIMDREDFIKPSTDENEKPSRIDFQKTIAYDPTIVAELIANSRNQLTTLKKNIQSRSGVDLLDFILADTQESKKKLFDSRSLDVIITGMNALGWINTKMNEWLGEKNAADTLAQSAPGNVTSEMGLALLDVADVIRPFPEVVEYLVNVKDDNFLNGLTKLNGGSETKAAIEGFVSQYGMRCAGEIDITRPRWGEKPATLVPIIVSNVRNFEPGAGARKFEQGRREALKKEEELLGLLKQLPDGEQKAKETKDQIELIRNYSGYREYPKYSIVSRYFIYKQALLQEAERLVQSNVIKEKEDIFYLAFEELHEVVRTRKLDQDIIPKRKEEYRLFEKLTPPRVITSDGEVLTGSYKRGDLPVGAIAGLAVSSGVIEGRARVILNMEDANIEDGDILVTRFTDPSWTPLFVSIKGLVTEVGGLMTHGAVIAREYGLPAVVGVDNGTKLITDGQRIRVNGTEGYVEVVC